MDTRLPLFVSLGMLVLDELHLPDGTIQKDIIGGSGAYSTLGARLAVYEGDGPRVASLVLAGDDFPLRMVENQFRAWGISQVIRTVRGRTSTRGRLEYHDWEFGEKSYEYLIPPLQPQPKDLPIHFLRSSAFHLLSSPEALMGQVDELHHLRSRQGISDRPLLVWEPAPLSCKPELLEAHMEASRLVEVFSPNHIELLTLCGRPSKSSSFDHRLVESCASTFMATDHPNPRNCIVRCGEHGALVLERAGSESEVRSCWIAPLFSPNEMDLVVDATGGGNTFLGAFTVEYQRNGRDAASAASRASVAASFSLEQVGLPSFDGSMWNGTTLAERVMEYIDKVN